MLQTNKCWLVYKYLYYHGFGFFPGLSKKSPETLSSRGALQLLPYTALTTCPGVTNDTTNLPIYHSPRQGRPGAGGRGRRAWRHSCVGGGTKTSLLSHWAARFAQRTGGRTPSMLHSTRKSWANIKQFLKTLKTADCGPHPPPNRCTALPPPPSALPPHQRDTPPAPAPRRAQQGRASRPPQRSVERPLPDRLRMISRNSSVAASSPAAAARPGCPTSLMPKEYGSREGNEAGGRARPGEDGGSLGKTRTGQDRCGAELPARPEIAPGRWLRPTPSSPPLRERSMRRGAISEQMAPRGAGMTEQPPPHRLRGGGAGEQMRTEAPCRLGVAGHFNLSWGGCRAWTALHRCGLPLGQRWPPRRNTLAEGCVGLGEPRCLVGTGERRLPTPRVCGGSPPCPAALPGPGTNRACPTEAAGPGAGLGERMKTTPAFVFFSLLYNSSVEAWRSLTPN